MNGGALARPPTAGGLAAPPPASMPAPRISSSGGLAGPAPTQQYKAYTQPPQQEVRAEPSGVQQHLMRATPLQQPCWCLKAHSHALHRSDMAQSNSSWTTVPASCTCCMPVKFARPVELSHAGLCACVHAGLPCRCKLGTSPC